MELWAGLISMCIFRVFVLLSTRKISILNPRNHPIMLYFSSKKTANKLKGQTFPRKLLGRIVYGWYLLSGFFFFFFSTECTFTFLYLSIRFFSNAKQKEKWETQEEPLQHANNHDNTRPTNEQDSRLIRKKESKHCMQHAPGKWNHERLAHLSCNNLSKCPWHLNQAVPHVTGTQFFWCSSTAFLLQPFVLGYMYMQIYYSNSLTMKRKERKWQRVN